MTRGRVSREAEGHAQPSAVQVVDGVAEVGNVVVIRVIAALLVVPRCVVMVDEAVVVVGCGGGWTVGVADDRRRADAADQGRKGGQHSNQSCRPRTLHGPHIPHDRQTVVKRPNYCGSCLEIKSF